MGNALVFKVADVSYGHLTEQTRRLVVEDRCPGRSFFPWGDMAMVMTTAPSEVGDESVPADLARVWNWAAAQGADYLKFDPDGRVYDDLPWYGEEERRVASETEEETA